MIRNGEYFRQESKTAEFLRILGYVVATMGGAVITILTWVSLPV